MDHDFTDDDLPDYWKDADQLSQKAQKKTIITEQARIGGSLLAAAAGAASYPTACPTLCAFIVFIGFAITLFAEAYIAITKPYTLWYEGRALAESAKTLAWRYAVRADPFDGEDCEARSLLIDRLEEISTKIDNEIGISPSSQVITPGMESLRATSFEIRRATYIERRTRCQHSWYVSKAEYNQKRKNQWSLFLITAEVSALVFSFAAIVGERYFDIAGLMAAIVTAGAAWISLKQHSSLTSAYAVTAKELKIQLERLPTLSNEEWATGVADAEEAISREHTMWLASRAGRLL